MKMLIACIRRWFRGFCDRFSTYELCHTEEKVIDIQLPHKEVVGNEAAVSASAPIPLSETTDTINKRKKHNGLDSFITKLRRDAKRRRREFYEGRRYDYNYRR